MQAGKRLQSDEKVIQDSWVGVHSSIEESDLDVTGINFKQPHLKLIKLLSTKFPCWKT
jgi:hypothetical protein